ncbi:extracellular solute-binding protein [Denitratisoma sp. agr-D3]
MTTTPHNLKRRRLLKGLAAGAAVLAAPIPLMAHTRPAKPRPVVVLTAYPDDVVSRFEAAFEKAHPEFRLQIVWRMPHDALPYLRQPQQSGVDVYWSASPRTYATLAREGAFRPLPSLSDGLPNRIGNASLADPQGFYRATEMAGFGFAVNRGALAQRGLPVPATWRDLADPRYQGLIALPVPSKVGFAPPLVEIVLQAYGWEAGWALWSEIAGNAGLIERGSTFVSDEVGSGRRPIGLSIDFFVASAIANGAPLEFIYPDHSGINPAHIALTRSAPNPAGAQAFVEFVLSKAGQTLLTHPDIRKLPVRPDVYAGLERSYFNPFAAAERGVFDYDSSQAQGRLGLSTAMFEQMLMNDHPTLIRLWQRIHAAEAQGRDVASARAVLTKPPLTEAEASLDSLRRPFAERLEGSTSDNRTTLESAWRGYAQARREEADKLLKVAGA